MKKIIRPLHEGFSSQKALCATYVLHFKNLFHFILFIGSNNFLKEQKSFMLLNKFSGGNLFFQKSVQTYDNQWS
jgi:hypothetical protein